MKTLIVLLAFCINVEAQIRINLNGTTYQLNGHPRWLLDGPAGSITSRSMDPDGPGPQVAPKAVSSNLPWVALLDAVNATLAGGYNQTGFGSAGDVAQMFATVCFADNSQARACDAAKDMIDHLEDYVPIGLCVETLIKCGVGNGDYGIDSYGNFWITGWAAAYTMMRPLLSTAERQAFAAKMLNDVREWGGTNGSASTTCTNTTAAVAGVHVTGVSGTTVTLDNAAFGTAIGVGDRLFTQVSGWQTPKVTAIIDAKHATIDSPGVPLSGALYRRPAVFNTATDCGWLWTAKHDEAEPYVLARTGQSLSGTTLYPPTGGVFGLPQYGSGNLMFTDVWGLMQALDVLFEDDVNASVRSIPEFATAYTFWHDVIYAWAKQQWTGATVSGNNYGYVRAAMMVPGIAFMVQNSVAGPQKLDLMSGIWARNILLETMMDTFPGEPESTVQWGQLYASNYAVDMVNAQWLPILLRAFAGTPEAAYANYWMRNMLPSSAFRFGGSTAASKMFWSEAIMNERTPQNITTWTSFDLQSWLYLLTDPDDPAADLANAPLQKGFNVTDTLQYPISAFISRTGYKDPNATLLHVYAPYYIDVDNADHSWEGGNPGSYKIVKNNYLLTEDDWSQSGPAGLFNAGYTPAFSGSGQHTNYIQLGDDSNIAYLHDGKGGSGNHARMPKVFDRNDAMAYAMVDATGGYSNNPTRVYRHFMHMKKAGTQEFIIVYDDVATPAGIRKTTFLQYANHGVAPRGSTTLSGNVVSSNYPGTGHGDATQLLSTILYPRGSGTLAIFNDGRSYTGAGGNAHRISICASADGSTCDAANTTAEFLVVHMPGLGSTNQPPEMSTLVNGNFAGVQIMGSSPKVALFPRNGRTYNAVSFNSSYAGNGQIAVAGLRPGNYVISRNGVQAGVSAVGPDGICYLEGPSGSYTIGANPAATVISGASVAGAAVR